ncbi:MAG: epimerase, partial [Spirosoma sp.]|nr:epimerase [Spirosoma sp.]
TYIHDTIMGILRAMYHLNGFDVLNIGGGGTSISLVELVGLLEQAVGRKAIIDWQPDQPGDVLLTSADLCRAADRIGYRPTISMSEGIHRYIRWYSQEGIAAKLVN